MRIVRERLLLGIPPELSPESDGDIVQVADGVRTDGGLDRAHRLPSRSGAVEEVAPVVIAHGKADLVGAERRCEEPCRVGRDALA